MDRNSTAEQESIDRVTPEAPAPSNHGTVELVFDEERAVLVARVAEGQLDAPLLLDDLQRMVDEGGYAEFSFEANALNAVLRHLQNREYGDYDIATRRDAEISVSATHDRLQALVSTTRAYGGTPVTEGRLREAIARYGVAEDLVSSRALAQAAGAASVDNLVVAQGLPAQPGSDSRIEVLVDLEKEVSRPRENEQGRVDHYSVRDFVIVDAGTPVFRRHPPTKGVAGRDVFGKAIAARDGKDLPLPKDMPGVVPDARDPEIFVAEYKGHPVPISGGVRVDKTLIMEYVDLRTGNVDFDGSVLITGDVSAGVTVKATGDITVKGTVENAYLDAGGELAVARGMTGSESAMNGGRREVVVQAAGSVHAAFVCGVHIHAGRDVVVKEYLNHCDTFALGRVLVGQTGGNGLVVGGTCHGCQGVAVRTAGTFASVKTFIGVGMHDALGSRREQAMAERRELVAKLEQLKSMLASMEAKAADGDEQDKLIEKVRRTIEDFERRTVEVDVRIEQIDSEVESAGEAIVWVSQRVYPGVVVEIADEVLALRTEGSGGHFSLKDGEICWE